MNRTQTPALVVAFAMAFFAIGVPYWQIPYAKVALPDSIVNLWLLAPFVATAFVRAFNRVSFRRSFLVVGLAAPCAILLRVIVGIAVDPTSHNLWPFEVILAGGVGLGVSFCGALLGSGFLLLLGRNNAE